MPLKEYAELFEPNLFVDKVAPELIPSFPFPLSSLASPLKGHQPTSPFVGT